MNKRYFTILIIFILLFTSFIPMTISNNNFNSRGKKVNSEKIINKFNENLMENLSFFNIKNDLPKIRQNMIDFNYTLKGYITDNITNNPISDANVFIIWKDKPTYHTTYNLLNSTPDSTGFYSFNISVEEAWIFIHANNYYHHETYLNPGNNDILWFNFSLKPGRLPESSIIKGWVTNSDSEPINNAFIYNFYIEETSNYANQTNNFTYTDNSGFYMFRSSPGLVGVVAFADGYFYNGYSQNLSENETIILNITLEPLPPEISIVKGYVIDNTTGYGINDTEVEVSWSNGIEYYNHNHSSTDESGFYQLNVPSGDIIIYIRNYDYFRIYNLHYEMSEYEVLWYNVTLTRKPPENSVINGYIYDNKTGLPIEHALIDVTWYDDENSNFNLTFSNSTGFYRVNIAGGTFDIYAAESSYFNHDYDNLYIGENETMQIDFYLIPRPIEKSQIHGYIFDNRASLPIKNVRLYVLWSGGNGFSYTNSTESNSSGYYSLNVANGSIRLSAYIDNYFTESSGYFNISDYEDMRLDLYLDKRPPQNSVIFGFVFDKKTGEQIVDTFIHLNWKGEIGYIIWNHSFTDDTGFYSMNVAEGQVNLGIYETEHYYGSNVDDINISENETLQINFLLSPIALENSRVYGYITDNKTGLPIHNALVWISWKDNEDHYDYNETFSDENGFYSMYTPGGIVTVGCLADKYHWTYTEEYIIDENEDYCINISLDEEPKYVII
ncbi:MAG: carboxypeptidase regulatory-like domain-containing protein, partial [Thermoplasmatales archaeon]|nr:carboxypeptidase regulatory-like domain-containing protein [Thermoplasmatales archaeon]